MRYATFRKDFFVTDEAKFLVKIQRVRLCVKENLTEAHLTGFLNQPG